MHTPTLTKNFTAGGAVAARRIVAIGAADGAVIQGAAADDPLIGVSTDVAAVSGARVDVHLAGVVSLEFGGVVARGGPVTSDANGKGVAAAPDTDVRIIGFAVHTTADGDIAPLLIAPSFHEGNLDPT